MLLKEQWKECVKLNSVPCCYSRLHRQFLDVWEGLRPTLLDYSWPAPETTKSSLGRKRPSQYCKNSASLARRESDSCFRWHWCVISASYALQHPYQLLVLLHQPCSEKAAGLETRRWRGKVGRKSCWFLGEEVKEEKRCHGRTGKGSKLPGSAQ